MSSSTFTKAEAEAKDVELAIEYDEWTGRIELSEGGGMTAAPRFGAAIRRMGEQSQGVRDYV